MSELHPVSRPTEYGGYLMRSQLEARFAAAMDYFGVEWSYEPKRFYGPHTTWLPDFRVQLDAPAYVELKGSFTSRESDPPSRVVRNGVITRISVAWLTEPDADLFLLEAGEQFREHPEGIPPMGYVGRKGRWYRGGFGRCTCDAYRLFAIRDETPCAQCGAFDDASVLIWPVRARMPA